MTCFNFFRLSFSVSHKHSLQGIACRQFVNCTRTVCKFYRVYTTIIYEQLALANVDATQQRTKKEKRKCLSETTVPSVPRIDIMQAASAARTIVQRTILKRSRRKGVTVSNERERHDASWLNRGSTRDKVARNVSTPRNANAFG